MKTIADNPSGKVFTPLWSRIAERILSDDNLQNVACVCADWEEFVFEISEWGIYKLGGVDFDTLTEADIEKLDQFIHSENGYIREED